MLTRLLAIFISGVQKDHHALSTAQNRSTIMAKLHVHYIQLCWGKQVEKEVIREGGEGRSEGGENGKRGGGGGEGRRGR